MAHGERGEMGGLGKKGWGVGWKRRGLEGRDGAVCPSWRWRWRGGECAVQGIEGRRRIRTSPAAWMREEASLDIPLEDMGGVGQQASMLGLMLEFGKDPLR